MWNQQQYEKVSKDIATEFVCTEGGSTINSQAVKIAAAEGLVPEQIRTMVRLANVETFQQLFAKSEAKKTAEDRMIEFEPGDAEIVINQLKEAASEKCNAPTDSCTCDDPSTCSCKIKKASYDRVQDFHGELYPSEPMEKKASAPEEVEEVPTKNPLELRLLVKEASEQFQMEQYESEFIWKDRLEKAAHAFKLLHGSQVVDKYAHFEEDVISTLEEDSLPELQVFQGMIGGNINAAVPSVEKVAHIRERRVAVLDESHRQVVTFLKEAQTARSKYLECVDGKKVLAQYVKRLDALENVHGIS